MTTADALQFGLNHSVKETLRDLLRALGIDALQFGLNHSVKETIAPKRLDSGLL